MTRRAPILLLLLLLAASCRGQKEEELYVIARDKSWFPLNLMGKANNLTAFTDDLLYAVAKEEGIYLELISVTADRLLGNLDTGFYDGAITFMNPTAVNLDHYEFSTPFFFIGPVLVVEEGSSVRGIEDLQGGVVGIQEHSKDIFDFKGYSTLRFSSYENILMALTDLSLGRLDAVLMSSGPAHVFTNSALYRGVLKVATPPLTQEGLRLITIRNPAPNDLIDLFNRGLEKIRKKGTYEALLKKWDLH